MSMPKLVVGKEYMINGDVVGTYMKTSKKDGDVHDRMFVYFRSKSGEAFSMVRSDVYHLVETTKLNSQAWE